MNYNVLHYAEENLASYQGLKLQTLGRLLHSPYVYFVSMCQKTLHTPPSSRDTVLTKSTNFFIMGKTFHIFMQLKNLEGMNGSTQYKLHKVPLTKQKRRTSITS